MLNVLHPTDDEIKIQRFRYSDQYFLTFLPRHSFRIQLILIEKLVFFSSILMFMLFCYNSSQLGPTFLEMQRPQSWISKKEKTNEKWIPLQSVCKTKKYLSIWHWWDAHLTLFSMGIFEAAHGWGTKKAPPPKICHTYPTMIKLGTVMPYLKKIQKTYKSRDKPLDFFWHQHFFTGNQQLLLHQETHIDCILICILIVAVCLQ